MEVSVLVSDVMLADAAEKLMLASHGVRLPFSDDVMMSAVGNLAEAFGLPMRLQIAAYGELVTRRNGDISKILVATKEEGVRNVS